MTDFAEVYRSQAEAYDRMVGFEDYQNNLPGALDELINWNGQAVLELGAGTGRMTRMLAARAGRVLAIDHAPAMLSIARRHQQREGWHNCGLALADLEALPVADGSTDLVLAGWALGHSIEWHPQGWRQVVSRALTEMQRCLRPGGSVLILETLGTGQETPAAPTDGLADYYQHLESESGFERSWLRTDYRFPDPGQAAEAVRFFFGNELADSILRQGLTVLPECTGIWRLTI
ncbi:MAG TPA: methyltransferase domain-containing protein [Anaerolineales bacterium]|jgi:ubiquinone/menaquinone biosynthesis C-methylase UbiE